MEAQYSFTNFLDYVYILDPPPGGDIIKWQPWPYLYDLATELPTLNLLTILKARQLGFSWLLAAYAVWRALSRRGSTILLLSQGQLEAQELLSKCRFVYDHLPPWLQPMLTRGNQEELEFQGIYSSMHALPSTEKAGASFTASLVICDEHAKHPYAASNFAALEPTINAGAQFISLSSAFGFGNFFQQHWKRAVDGTNGFSHRFYGALLRPGRDMEWYERTRATYEGLPHLFHQEYPLNDSEAFVLTAGVPVFDLLALEHLLQGVHEPIAFEQYPLGSLSTYQLPQAGQRYVVGADVSYGLETPDSSVAQVIAWRTGMHVATLAGHFPPEEFAEKMVGLCRQYNDAFLGVENNGVGKFALRRIGELDYSNPYQLYYNDWKKAVSLGKPPEQPGWATNDPSRPVMIADLAEAIRGGGLATFDRETIDEMRTFVFNAHNRPQAAEGAHDDRVMALAIAWQMRQVAPAPETPGRVHAPYIGVIGAGIEREPTLLERGRRFR